MLGLLVGALVFVAVGVWTLRQQPVTSWIGIVFFGIGAVFAALNLLPNSSYLEITREGFTICSSFRRRFIEWQHVGRFGVSHVGFKKMVGWDEAQSTSKIGATNKFLTGHSSALPDTYGLTAEELVHLMNRMRDEYSSKTI
jgi:hypothetical protein